MSLIHRARMSPLLPETAWVLEDEVLIERRGPRERRFPLSELRRLHVSAGLAVAAFRTGRVRIGARSFVSPLSVEDRSDSFHALTRALAAEGAVATPRLRLAQGRTPEGREALVWIVVLCAMGALAVLMASAFIGAWALGLALAARLSFVLILALAVWPWLNRREA